MSVHPLSPLGDRRLARSDRKAPRAIHGFALVVRLVAGAALAGALAGCGAGTPTSPQQHGIGGVHGDQSTTTTTDTTARSGYQNPMV